MNDILISTLFVAEAGGSTLRSLLRARKEGRKLILRFDFQNNVEIRPPHFSPKEKTFVVGLTWAEKTFFRDLSSFDASCNIFLFNAV